MFSASIIDAAAVRQSCGTQGLWCLSWRQPPNPVVDTGSKGCRQAEEGVFYMGPCWPVGLLTLQLTRVPGRLAKQATARAVLEAKTRVWEEFGEAMKEDYRVPQASGCCGAVLADTPLQHCMEVGESSAYLWSGKPRVVVPFLKRGTWRVCSNYRGITLLSLPGKVYARERRIQLIVEPRIQEEQYGFCPGRGTLDQLYTLQGAGCLRVYGSLPNQSTCALWIWRRHSTVSLRGILWGVLLRVWGPGALC
ncbi:hypothetical protein L3Q82_001785 [Scortum barcoo]|uniref:Uncharacterized protein n=1 Tax=Scortum barcoo TaxID=214431 RepID=A0ACB8W3Z2_9TELE|nr:hypothetical protein L3Q82_001785 [Scortum barcoo]